MSMGVYNHPQIKKPSLGNAFWEILKAMFKKSASLIKLEQREDVQINKPGFWKGKRFTLSRTFATPPPKQVLRS